MKYIKEALQYLAEEYHWRQIILLKTKMNQRYEHGAALSSRRMVRLGKLTSKHCISLQATGKE